MTIFCDINVLVVALVPSDPKHAEVRSFFRYARKEGIRLVTTVYAIPVLLHILKRSRKDDARKAIELLLEFIELADLTIKIVLDGIKSNWKDPEDFMIATQALNSSCDLIFTYDQSFPADLIPVFEPGDWMTSRK